MDRPCDHLLAGAGLALQQHGIGVVQDLADQAAGLTHRRAPADQPVAADHRCAGRSLRLAGGLREALQQMQLGQHERAQLAQWMGESLQVQWAPGSADHHALDRFLRAHQRNAEQGQPGLLPCRQEAGLVQPRRQVDETDHAVLAQGELQQLLAGVVRRQARRLQRLQQAVPAFGVEGERGMGLVEQIQLAQARSR